MADMMALNAVFEVGKHPQAPQKGGTSGVASGGREKMSLSKRLAPFPALKAASEELDDRGMPSREDDFLQRPWRFGRRESTSLSKRLAPFFPPSSLSDRVLSEPLSRGEGFRYNTQHGSTPG